MSRTPGTAAPLDPSAADVVVALSSYNGSRFIAEQIESIRRQHFTGWTLLVRDDGSTDDTVPIVESLAHSDSRIVLVRDRLGNLGPAASFGVLLERAVGSGARYVALADQDDVWEPEKLARQLGMLRAREAAVGAGTPLLTHSDLTVVAEDLGVLHPSFLTFQGLQQVPGDPLGRLLVQNFVTGCTVLVNRALVRAALPFPNVIMHDWWLALCAAAMGEVLCLPEPTVRYRQHDRNTLGARGWRQACLEMLRRPLAWWRLSGSLFSQAVAQAGELVRRVERESSGRTREFPSLRKLQEFHLAFGSHGGAWRRLRVTRGHGFMPRSLLPIPVFYYARVLLWSSPTTSAARAMPGRSTADSSHARPVPTLSAKD
jgi:hypothetical protein